jgi:uncharacterized protein (TIGR03435 family)
VKTAGDVAVSGDDESGQLRAMLKALLVERFHLQVHTDTCETDACALVLAYRDGKLGPALKKSQADCSSAPQGASLLGVCGIRGGNGDITYTGLVMSQIATSLAGQPAIRRPVSDRTGLSGRDDLHLQYSPTGNAADADPAILTALMEQARLRLQPDEARIDVIVIDHVERPSAD